MKRIFDTLRKTVLRRARRGRMRVLPDPGLQVASPGRFWELATMPEPSRPYYEWMWLISGKGSVRIGEAMYALRPGDFCFFPPFVDRITTYTRETGDFQTLGFAYWPGIMHGHLFQYAPFGVWSTPEHLRTYGSPALGLLLASLHHEMSAEHPHKAEALQGLVLQLIAATLRDIEAMPDKTILSLNTENAVALIHRLLHEQYNHDWTLRALARETHLHPRYLATIFKARTGRTIFQTLRDIRIEHAKPLLLEGTLPLDQIARAVGYHSGDRFTRVFREATGQPPTQFGRNICGD